MKLRVEWRPGPERQLLQGIRSLEIIMRVCEAVERFAATLDGHAERVLPNDPRLIRLMVAGRAVLVNVDETAQTLTVIGIYFVGDS